MWFSEFSFKTSVVNPLIHEDVGKRRLRDLYVNNDAL